MTIDGKNMSYDLAASTLQQDDLKAPSTSQDV